VQTESVSYPLTFAGCSAEAFWLQHLGGGDRQSRQLPFEGRPARARGKSRRKPLQFSGLDSGLPSDRRDI